MPSNFIPPPSTLPYPVCPSGAKTTPLPPCPLPALCQWGQDDTVCSCGLFHSAYSNSYVNVAIFKAEEDGRPRLRELVGQQAEELIHFFCRGGWE